MSINILDMELDLPDTDFFHTLDVELVKIFGVDMGSSTKIDNCIKDILILVKGSNTERTLSARKLYSINFTENNK